MYDLCESYIIYFPEYELPVHLSQQSKLEEIHQEIRSLEGILAKAREGQSKG